MNEWKPFAVINVSMFIIISLMIMVGCEDSQSGKNDKSEYGKKIREWRQQRIESLTQPNSWLSLVGLFWLNEGENSFGSDSTNDFIFPSDGLPQQMGSYFLNHDKITVKIKPGINVLYMGRPVQEMKIKTDNDGEATVFSYKSLSWYIIKRGDRFALRLKDSESPALKQFKGIETFPINRDWQISAKLQPYDSPKKIKVPTVLGTVIEQSSPGILVFEIEGVTYRLEPLAEPGDKHFFIIFSDETNGYETYGAGRFLYAERPAASGVTILDFNKAYNPPCAFSEYATCPLPPAQNQLPVKITAGEKKLSQSSHH